MFRSIYLLLTALYQDFRRFINRYCNRSATRQYSTVKIKEPEVIAKKRRRYYE